MQIERETMRAYYRDQTVGLSIDHRDRVLVDPVFNGDFSSLSLMMDVATMPLESVSSVPAGMVAGISSIFCMICQG
jgi:hypothetical protein